MNHIHANHEDENGMKSKSMEEASVDGFLDIHQLMGSGVVHNDVNGLKILIPRYPDLNIAFLKVAD
jgi:hypothetical protein